MMANDVIELNASLELVVDLRLELGEGPIWDEASNSLLFVDSLVGHIYRLDPASGALSRINVKHTVGTAIPRAHGGFAASSVEGLLAVQANGKSRVLVSIEADRPHCRMNDAKCDSRGRLLSGTLSMPFQAGANALYRVDADLTAHRLLDGITVSNGLGWSPDEKIFYYIDTSTRAVDRFDYDIDTGEIANRRRFVDIARGDGFPDGMCVDAEGHVWLALYHGSKVRRYAPDGRLVAQITLPVSGVTSCNFGGAALTDLYITTAHHGVADEKLADEPHAGQLFRCCPGVSGLPSHRFAG